MTIDGGPSNHVPWFGARKLAKQLAAEVQAARADRTTIQAELEIARKQCEQMRERLERFGAMTVVQLEKRHAEMQVLLAQLEAQLNVERGKAAKEHDAL